MENWADLKHRRWVITGTGRGLTGRHNLATIIRTAAESVGIGIAELRREDRQHRDRVRAAHSPERAPGPDDLAAIGVLTAAMFTAAGMPRAPEEILDSLEAEWGGVADAGRPARIAAGQARLRAAAGAVRRSAADKIPDNVQPAAIAVAIAMGAQFFIDACATPPLFNYAGTCATGSPEFFNELLGFDM